VRASTGSKATSLLATGRRGMVALTTGRQRADVGSATVTAVATGD
jgi:hypothetical protein